MRETLGLPARLDANLWLHRNSGTNYFMHCHEELEINMAMRGRATYLVNNQRHDLTPGTLLWLFADQEHLLIEQSRDFEMWVVVFSPAMARQTCDGSASILLERDPAGGFCVQLPAASLRALDGLYRDLQLAIDDAPRFNAGMRYALLQTWAGYQLAEARPPIRTVHPAVELAARLLHHNPGSYSLTDLADKAGLSASRLSRLFRRQMGLTLVSYRQRRCLERFLDLFSRTPDRKLLALAMQAGFGSYPQFHRVFLQHMGRTPAEFLRQPD